MITRIAETLARHDRTIALAVFVALTPLLYVACFPPLTVNEAAFVFLVPFVIWLKFQPSNRQVFLVTTLVGWGAWIVIIFWLRHVTWAGMIGLSLVMGLHFSLWALGVAWLSRRSFGAGMWRGVPLAVGAAALWVVVEHVRGFIFTGFPWLPLAASQVEEPMMLQGASFFGSWSVSFALVFMNLGIASYLLRLVGYAQKRSRQICPEFYLALSFLVGTTFLQLGASSGQQREKVFRAGVVQPNIPQNIKWDAAFANKVMNEVETATRWLGPLKPDAIFWPEASLPYPLNDDGALETWGTRLATSVGAPIYAGALAVEERETGDAWYNSVFLVRPEYGLFPLYYSKQHLVPFGEYIPLRWLWPWMEKFVPIDGDFLPGETAQLLPLYLGENALRLGSLICFEDVFPSIARRAVREGAGLLFVSTNSAWYGKSAAADQHRAHSVLRAVETRRPVLRVGNDGWTGWIDEYGSVRDQLDKWEQVSTVWQISRDRRWVGKQSVYVRYGDWFVWVCWGLLICSALLARSRVLSDE
ncbi:apolipoprotein N-acyltransferase [Pelagicoccus sp. SDUM812003]|uniref:apolipoprotein N-acyltransferase n=1 Tax=Pelagicoccus sp. SDUM812003 TaxID=3041267 RepID=UPI00280FC6CA|nr:apolipoprotein N-acyltransferase [Pelagicoccus sp. SDUM812003]MDQ8205702.1 apolipoprotein N-acyltransferase [Pelagicoccus sp. SDUM812003]